MKKLPIYILVLFLIVVSPAQAKVLDIQEITTPGGISAWLVEDHSLPIVAMRYAFVGAGAYNDPAEKQGLSLLVSNNMDEGAGDLPSQDFQKQLDDYSISLSFSATRDDYQGTLQSLSRHKERAFDLLRLALTFPRFDAEPLARMRDANLSRIRGSLSNPDWMAARLLNDVAYEGHPYAYNAGGTLTSLHNITQDDLREFVNTRLSQDRLKIAIVGDMTAEEAAIMIDQVFGALPKAAPKIDIARLDVQNAGAKVNYTQEIPQTILQMIQPGISRDHPDFQAAQVMNFIFGGSGFGSRLTEEIREKRGLTYGIYSSFQSMRGIDSLNISSSTKNEAVGKVLDLVREAMVKMQQELVSADELQRAKSYMVGALPLQLTSTSSIANMLLSLQLDDLPNDYLDQRAAAIEAVTAEDVMRVAQNLLKPDDLTVVMVGQPQGVENVEIVTELPNVQ
jgi:zinc protease